MIWLNDLNGRVERDAPLAPHTWYKVGGRASFLVSPSDQDELAAVLRAAADDGCPVKVLGVGANVLVRDGGFDGLVIRLDAPSFCETRFEDAQVYVGAGVPLMELTRTCAYRGLAGIEALAGVPASIGGAIRMNAGGRLGQMSDVVEEATLVDTRGEVRVQSRQELRFGYRASAVGDRIVTSAVLALMQSDVKETVPHFLSVWREKTGSQPISARSAGCVFKNPAGQSAGALIDRAGLKSFTSGGAMVSDRHANFIVAHESATAADVLAVIDHVRTTVDRECGVALELEIDIW